MNTNNVTSLHQSGFSITTALTDLGDDTSHSLNKKKSVLVLLHFSSAFDALNNSLMIAKCSHIDTVSLNCNKT